MNKKQLNTEAVISELTGQSAFFKKEKGTDQPPRRSEGQEVGREKAQKARRFTSPEEKRLPELVAEGWDDDPTWKGSHNYTDRERDLFDDVVLRLRREFGLEVQKRTVARAAIRLLADELTRSGEKSFIVSLLTGRIKEWFERTTSQEVERPGG